MNRRTLLKGLVGAATAAIVAPPTVAEAAEEVRRYWALDSTHISPKALDPLREGPIYESRGDFIINDPKRFPYQQTTIYVGQSYNPLIDQEIIVQRILRGENLAKPEILALEALEMIPAFAREIGLAM